MNTHRIPILFAMAVAVAAGAGAPRDLEVSENRRFLQQADGAPFFWLADTAWELFHRLDREDAVRYLDVRASQGFTAIQAVALAEFDGLRAPNAYGHLPLAGDDPARPDVRDGPGNDYWDHVDFIVRAANDRGLVVGFLPTWGDKWNKKWGQGPEIFTPENARAYGAWLGRRYRDAAIVWILGGDRPIETDLHRAIVTAMAGGLAEGDAGRHLRTFHPMGGRGSSEWFHDAAWLDFNMRQNGHGASFNPTYEKTLADYKLTPPKPVLDGEPVYEGHPISFKASDHGISIAADVRRPVYWDLFGGACGHTYGHHSVWQMWTAKREPKNHPILPWTEAVLEPGARQMQHARRLMESRPFFTRVPDDSVLVPSAVPNLIPGAGLKRFVATRASDGAYAMIYAPCGRPFGVRMDKVSGGTVRAWWFNPRTGAAEKAGEFPNTGERTFTPPDPGEQIDWVLVLDDASLNFPAPGVVAVRRP